jgi:hypothetical protein
VRIRVSEFLAIWSELEEVASRARAEAKNVALKVCKLIKEKYWKKIEKVSRKYNLRPVLGLEVNSYDILGYRPVLYLFSDSPRDRDLANRVYEELGDWVSDARLSVVVLTEEDRKFMKLEFV